MKNILIFLFGAVVGAGGMLLWLRKDIKKELENVKTEAENAENVPFTMNEKSTNESKNSENDSENVAKSEQKTLETPVVGAEFSGYNGPKTPYHTFFQDGSGLPVMPRDSELFGVNGASDNENDDPEAGFVDAGDADGGVIEIDKDEFNLNDSYEKERLIYFRGDRIMSTENGEVITNPFILVGGNWDKCVGKYATNTAFIRNSRLVEDYEIFVEDGLYSDEFGPPDGYRED